jgi:membrane protein DedA with SNARE-associated domain
MVFGFMGGSLLWLIGWIAVIWAVVDIVSQKKETGWKLIWLIIAILLNIVGVIIYYFISGRKAKKK